MQAKLTLDAEFVALKAEFDVQQLITAIYASEPRSDIAARLAILAEHGPKTIPEYAAEITGCLSDFERLVFLLISLRSVTEECHWIHFELANLHHGFMLMGLRDTYGAKFLHASLALADGKLNTTANAVLYGMLSGVLLSVSPREALDIGAKCVRLGRLENVATVQRAIAALPESRQSEIKRDYGDQIPASSTGGGKISRLAGVSVKAVTDASTIILPAPAKHGEHYIFKKQILKSPALDVMVIQDATLSVDLRRPGMTEFYVFNKNGAFIPQVSRGQVPFRLAETQHIKETVALIDDRFSQINICHFLLDKLPRLALYDRIGATYRPMMFRRDAYYDQVMAFLGLDKDLVCLGSDHFTVKIDTLLVSTGNASAFSHPAQWFPQWAIDYLKDKFAPDDQPADKRIFISRNDAKTRRILNQPDVDAVLTEFGYVSEELAGRSFAEQRALFASASHVVGVHGAGLTNVLFSPPGTQVLEILAPMCASASYWRLSAAMGHRYHAAIAADPDFAQPDYTTWQHKPALNSRDVIVSPALLRERLTEMEQTTR